MGESLKPAVIITLLSSILPQSRQYLVTELQLNCQPPVDSWQLAQTAIILNPGLPEDGVKKSRSYLMNLRAAAIMAAEESDEESEEPEEELEELEPDDESDNEEIGHSEPSQLSYRYSTGHY